jgi:hypothetical protein
LDEVDDTSILKTGYLHAARAVVEEGILPGGGVALLRAMKAIEKLRVANDDQRTGVEIVRKALSWPRRPKDLGRRSGAKAVLEVEPAELLRLPARKRAGGTTIAMWLLTSIVQK